MSCPICFFRENYQKKLKTDSFGISRFENKLRDYKKNFIYSIQKMDSLSKCSCISSYNNKNMIEWTDAFLNELERSRYEISNTFDSLIGIYDFFINGKQKIATDKLWEYLNTSNYKLFCNNDNDVKRVSVNNKLLSIEELVESSKFKKQGESCFKKTQPQMESGKLDNTPLLNYNVNINKDAYCGDLGYK